MKKSVFAILLSTAAIVAGPVACTSGKDDSSAAYTIGTELGISKAAMDTGVKPGDDFYAYANGNWQKTTEIPADRSSTGAFYTAFLETEKRNRELVDAMYDDREELDRITAPTLLIWGDADRLVDRHMQSALLERISIAELLVYPRVGHTPRWERPARFADDVAAFAERTR